MVRPPPPTHPGTVINIPLLFEVTDLPDCWGYLFLFVTHFLCDLQRIIQPEHITVTHQQGSFLSVLDVFTMSVTYLISKSINSLKTWPVGVLSCIPGAQACVLVFSTTDRESYQAIDSWREKVEAEVGDIPTVLVQNKIDLLEDTVIKKFVIVYFMPK